MKTFVLKLTVAIGTVVLAVSANRARAKIIQSPSASYNDVSNTVASALPGDTVLIPAGTATWTEPLVLNGISLEGSGTNQTIITDEENRSSSNPSVITLVAEPGILTEVSGLRLQGGTINTGINYSGAIACFGTTNSSWRVNNCVFTNLYAKNVDASGNSLCVIDHNTFYMRSIAIEDNGAFPNDGYGNVSWASPPTYGLASSNCLYVEDNFFTNIVGYVASVGACDGEGGGRIVFRHNTVWNDLFNNHGTESGGVLRSERSFEIYNNSFNFSPTAPDYPGIGIAFIRGGSGVIYSNTASGYKQLVDLRYYRYMYDYSGQWDPFGGANGTNNWDSNSPTLYRSGTSAGPNGVTYLYDPTTNWAPNVWTGYMLDDETTKTNFAPILSNTVNTVYYLADPTISQGPVMTFNTGDRYAIYRVYAALDQPGRGSGDLLEVVPPFTNANVINTRTGTVSWPDEALDGIYCWSNTIAGTNAGMSSEYSTLLEGRDFYNDTLMPAYTPYVYPHPLVSGTNPPPPPPTNSLVARWKLDEGSGTTVADSSGSGNTGTFAGSTLPEWTNGVLYFNHSGYITAGTNNIPTTFPITVSYWVNFGPGGGGGVVARLSWNSEADWECLDSDAEMNVGNGDVAYVSFTNAIDDGNWHLVTETVTDNGNGTGTANIYLDGNYEQSNPYGSSAGPSAGTPTVSIGVLSDHATSLFTGYINDVRIYNYALDITNIQELYATGPAIFEDITNGIVAWWKFDEGSGTVAHDSSRSGNDGTLGGSTLPQWTNGALYFNGSGYISAGTNNVPITFPLTISYWVNYGPGGGGTVASRLQFNSAADWLCFDSTADVPVANADLEHLSLPTAIDDGNWHLVTETVTDNGNGTGTPNIYLDGVLQQGNPYGANYGPNTVGTHTISIGVEQDYATSPFTGYIDDVRIYNNALNSTNIAKLYLNGRQ